MSGSDGHPAQDGPWAYLPGTGVTETLRNADRVLQDARLLRERLRQIAQEVAATENRVAATYLQLADQARRQGRLDDARRLEGEAAAALRTVDHEMQEARRWRPPPADRDRGDEVDRGQDEIEQQTRR